MSDLQQRLNNGEVKVVEQDHQPITDRESGFRYNGEYRILSDGRMQWRQLGNNGRISPFWNWENC